MTGPGYSRARDKQEESGPGTRARVVNQEESGPVILAEGGEGEESGSVILSEGGGIQEEQPGPGLREEEESRKNSPGPGCGRCYPALVHLPTLVCPTLPVYTSSLHHPGTPPCCTCRGRTSCTHLEAWSAALTRTVTESTVTDTPVTAGRREEQFFKAGTPGPGPREVWRSRKSVTPAAELMSESEKVEVCAIPSLSDSQARSPPVCFPG